VTSTSNATSISTATANATANERDRDRERDRERDRDRRLARAIVAARTRTWIGNEEGAGWPGPREGGGLPRSACGICGCGSGERSAIPASALRLGRPASGAVLTLL
jgi:hypothetical protein